MTDPTGNSMRDATSRSPAADAVLRSMAEGGARRNDDVLAVVIGRAGSKGLPRKNALPVSAPR